MPHKVVEYIIRISASDRYRHLHIMDKGRVVFFRVQYETKIGDVWYPVVDTILLMDLLIETC